MDEQLCFVFPEQASLDFLLKKLEKAGMHRDELAKKASEEIVHTFFTFVAALPRRNPRNNRRGMLLHQHHRKELRLKQSTNNILLQKAEQHKAVKPRAMVRMEDNVSSTPEMDRLAARSKAAREKQVQNNDASKCADPDSHTIPKLRAINRKRTNTTNSSDAATCNTASSLESSPTKTDTSDQATERPSTKAIKVEPSEQSSAKKKSRRIKLKRPLFKSDALDSCKVKKSA